MRVISANVKPKPVRWHDLQTSYGASSALGFRQLLAVAARPPHVCKHLLVNLHSSLELLCSQIAFPHSINRELVFPFVNPAFIICVLYRFRVKRLLIIFSDTFDGLEY